MTETFTTYTMDYTGQVEHAMRGDGRWFSRCQYRDPRYGYKWGAWRPSSAPDRCVPGTGRMRRIRLPKDA